MNFSYIFAEDPLREKLQGNITWMIPKFEEPGHWQHTEDICKYLGSPIRIFNYKQFWKEKGTALLLFLFKKRYKVC